MKNAYKMVNAGEWQLEFEAEIENPCCFQWVFSNHTENNRKIVARVADYNPFKGETRNFLKIETIEGGSLKERQTIAKLFEAMNHLQQSEWQYWPEQTERIATFLELDEEIVDALHGQVSACLLFKMKNIRFLPIRENEVLCPEGTVSAYCWHWPRELVNPAWVESDPRTIRKMHNFIENRRKADKLRWEAQFRRWRRNR